MRADANFIFMHILDVIIEKGLVLIDRQALVVVNGPTTNDPSELGVSIGRGFWFRLMFSLYLTTETISEGNIDLSFQRSMYRFTHMSFPSNCGSENGMFRFFVFISPDPIKIINDSRGSLSQQLDSNVAFGIREILINVFLRDKCIESLE